MSQLTLGNKSFSTSIIQGPLAGVSCAPFRALTWQYSQPAYTCTEMISCKTLIHSSRKMQERFVKKDPNEGPVCFQLSGNHPNEIADATKIATQYGADLIDLNCGCPVKKIRGKGAGSRLLADPAKLSQLIKAMKASTHVPVSIKIRVDGMSDERFNHAIAEMLNDSGVDFVVVHGRHWTEHYETPVRHDEIRYFVEALKIPVIGNGDIACIDSLKRMQATGCAGVMLGRATVGQPWLIAKLKAELNNEIFQIPSINEIGQMFMRHTRELVELLENEKFAILQARKFAKYYARALPDKFNFCDSVNRCEDLIHLGELVQQYFTI